MHVLLLVAGLLIAGAVPNRALPQTDITGTWALAFQTDLGPTTATVTLKADAGKLTGHVSSPSFGEQDLAGTVSGQTFEFSIPGEAGPIPFKGTVENGELKGSFENPGVGNTGTFTGKRKQ